MKAVKNAGGALILCVLLSVAGCGGRGGYSGDARFVASAEAGAVNPMASDESAFVNQGVSAETGVGNPDSPQATAGESAQGGAGNKHFWPPNNQPITVGYAKVVSLGLRSLSVPGIDASQIRVVEGRELVEDLVVDGEELRFITPADPGRTGKIKLMFDGNRVKRSLNIEVAPSRPAGIVETSEFNEDDVDREPVPLLVKGLGPSNEILPGEDLVLEVGRKVRLDPEVSNALLNVGGKGTVSLQDYWKLTESGSGLVVSKEDLKTIIDRMPEGDIDISIAFNGAGEDGHFSRQWAFVARVRVADLRGRVVDSLSKEPIRHLAGRKVAVVGRDANGTRAVAVIDEEGRFGVDGLPAGRYTAELLDSSLPRFTSTWFSVGKQDRWVEVELHCKPPVPPP